MIKIDKSHLFSFCIELVQRSLILSLFRVDLSLSGLTLLLPLVFRCLSLLFFYMKKNEIGYFVISESVKLLLWNVDFNQFYPGCLSHFCFENEVALCLLYNCSSNIFFLNVGSYLKDFWDIVKCIRSQLMKLV